MDFYFPKILKTESTDSLANAPILSPEMFSQRNIADKLD